LQPIGVTADFALVFGEQSAAGKADGLTITHFWTVVQKLSQAKRPATSPPAEPASTAAMPTGWRGDLSGRTC
jgi:hypothetical protein